MKQNFRRKRMINNGESDNLIDSSYNNKNLKDMSLEEMDKLWDEAKLQEKKDDK